MPGFYVFTTKLIVFALTTDKTVNNFRITTHAYLNAKTLSCCYPLSVSVFCLSTTLINP